MNQVKTQSNAGFTMVELLVAMVIAGIITAIMYTAFEGQVRGQIAQDVSLKMNQSTRAAMDIMVSDIRMVGCDPTENANAGIITMDPNELRMTMDIGDGANGPPDGDINDPGEDVRYVIANGDLCRDIGGNTPDPQPLAFDCDALDFVYLDEDGAETTDPDDVNEIQVSIVVRSADTKNPGLLRNYTDNTTYRNMNGNPGEIIFIAPGDNFRRFHLNASADCRNLL